MIIISLSTTRRPPLPPSSVTCSHRKCGSPGGSCLPYIKQAQGGTLALPPRCQKPGCGGVRAKLPPMAFLSCLSIPPSLVRSDASTRSSDVLRTRPNKGFRFPIRSFALPLCSR